MNNDSKTANPNGVTEGHPVPKNGAANPSGVTEGHPVPLADAAQGGSDADGVTEGHPVPLMLIAVGMMAVGMAVGMLVRPFASQTT